MMIFVLSDGKIRYPFLFFQVFLQIFLSEINFFGFVPHPLGG